MEMMYIASVWSSSRLSNSAAHLKREFSMSEFDFVQTLGAACLVGHARLF